MIFTALNNYFYRQNLRPCTGVNQFAVRSYMKKPALIVIAVLLLAFISIYFIIPQKIKTINTIEIDANDANVARLLVNNKAWQKWWPGNIIKGDSLNYTYKKIRFGLHDNTNSGILATINQNDLIIESKLTYNSTEDIACIVTWETEMQSSLNPVARIKEYYDLQNLSADLQDILKRFKRFMQTDSNIYGLSIKVQKIKHPLMMITSTNITSYPNSNAVYALIDKLKQEAKRQNIAQVAEPMLNVHQTDDDAYQMMVALPIDKPVTETKDIQLNKMVLGGNILQTTITGGPGTLKNAFTQLKKYQKDHRLISPAMPYEVLVTDRLAEPDTSKWITKVYWPIF